MKWRLYASLVSVFVAFWGVIGFSEGWKWH
jgi:hypothetical protein